MLYKSELLVVKLHYNAGMYEMKKGFSHQSFDTHTVCKNEPQDAGVLRKSDKLDQGLQMYLRVHHRICRTSHFLD
jgi:hypothetical protein